MYKLRNSWLTYTRFVNNPSFRRNYYYKIVIFTKKANHHQVAVQHFVHWANSLFRFVLFLLFQSPVSCCDFWLP